MVMKGKKYFDPRSQIAKYMIHIALHQNLHSYIKIQGTGKACEGTTHRCNLFTRYKEGSQHASFLDTIDGWVMTNAQSVCVFGKL